MYHLPSYPALVPGPEIILGELWHFDPADMPRTLTVLDEVEHYVDGSDDLYTRHLTPCQGEASGWTVAWCYFFAHPEHIVACPRVVGGHRGVCWFPIAAAGDA